MYERINVGFYMYADVCVLCISTVCVDGGAELEGNVSLDC